VVVVVVVVVWCGLVDTEVCKKITFYYFDQQQLITNNQHYKNTEIP